MAHPDGSIPFFPPEHLELLRARGHPCGWETGDVLMREGGRPTELVLLEKGLVKVTAESSNGYTSVLAVRGPDELLGELSCVDGRPRSATVTALEPVRGTVVTADHFRRLLTERGALALAVLRSVTERLRDSDRLRAEHGAYPAVVRVARVLLELTHRYGAPPKGTPRPLEVRITQQELAGAAGASRETVVRALRLLQAEGWVALGRGRMMVTAPEQLAAWADCAEVRP
ncbi:Crp/Fnr family transcriptional regulator [Streptomyces xinghaiensis]|uniref:Crp/Fnr family transcriptional regulator n=1 Tax=Streptomyces xinghaiensis TaxID=1038928 RepID=UPI0037BD4458